MLMYLTSLFSKNKAFVMEPLPGVWPGTRQVVCCLALVFAASVASRPAAPRPAQHTLWLMAELRYTSVMQFYYSVFVCGFQLHFTVNVIHNIGSMTQLLNERLNVATQ